MKEIYKIESLNYIDCNLGYGYNHLANRQK